MRRRHPYCDEPLTFTYQDIVRLLRSAGYERFAAHVRELGQDKSDKLALERQWQQRYADVVQRLHVYEPPAPVVEDRGGKPSDMSDG